MKPFHVFAEIKMKQILEEVIKLAKAGYWDAAIDLIEKAINLCKD